MRFPDAAFVVEDAGDVLRAARRDGDRFTAGATEIALSAGDSGLEIALASSGPLSRVVLRWSAPPPEGALILGDAWERSYGDLQWRHVQPERVLPWSFLVHDAAAGSTRGVGVRVRPSTFCAWTVDEAGFSLWLDVRNGGSPVLLGDRTLAAATVVSVDGEHPYDTQRALNAAMCSDPLPVGDPVVGCNNWYYAYGVDFGPEQVIRDADTIVEYADGHAVRPYCVVDAGWSEGGVCPGGPWTQGVPGLFDDLPGLAAAVAERGARPGIWMRPAALSFVDDPARLRSGPCSVREKPLDLTLAGNLETIGQDVSRLVGWGFELVKHDFSTYDMFARWGPDMGLAMTEPGWSYADRSLTNAEILLGLYRTIRSAAGSAVVIGCNTVGHLAAGLVEVQRTGDDTSGREWERTRRMGVNTLAFRLAQHGSFFAVDADCVPCTPQTPWAKNRQFLDLVARSGTALFVSVDPASRTPEVDADLRAAVRLALSGGDAGGLEPVDWLRTTAPTQWCTGAGAGTETVSYDWLEPFGASAL
ncbi:alpha-amylase family protein [Flindersiella endophytica]